MRMNKIFIPAALIITLFTLSVAGCINFKPIEQAVMCSSVTKTGEPILITDTFPPDIKTIFCSVKLSNTTGDKKIKAEWYIVKSDEAGLANSLLNTESVAANALYAVFAFVRSDILLPRGDYEVRLYFDNKFIQSVPFKVQGEATRSSAVLSDATICTSIDITTGKPLDRMEIVPNNEPTLFCSVKVSNADFGTKVTARWIYIKGELEGFQDKTLGERATKVEAREYIAFPISRAGSKGFPIGEYCVKLFVEDKEQLSVPFKVVDSASIPGPYLSEAATFTYKGSSENQTLEFSGNFPANTETIYCKMKINNAPAGTELKIRWIIAKDAQGEVSDYQLREQIIPVEGNMQIVDYIQRKSDEFPRGDYSIKFLVNGTEQMTVPFKVQ